MMTDRTACRCLTAPHPPRSGSIPAAALDAMQHSCLRLCRDTLFEASTSVSFAYALCLVTEAGAGQSGERRQGAAPTSQHLVLSKFCGSGVPGATTADLRERSQAEKGSSYSSIPKMT